MRSPRQQDDAPTNSAALSLFELRRQLVQRAGVLSARARGLRSKGDPMAAARMAVESDRLLLVAKTMGENARRKKTP